MRFLMIFLLVTLSIFSTLRGEWAEKVLSEMSVKEKIGQLFILPAGPELGKEHTEELGALIKTYHIGGLIVKQATPEGQILFLNELQGLSKLPLLVTGDAEWGLGMRMKETISFPRNLTLGAIKGNEIITELGVVIGQQCKKVGMHLNFAPVIDVNNDPANPIIHTRSFGEDPTAVAEKGAALSEGIERAGVISCPKHFMGHGGVRVDSHHALPIVPYSKEHLAQVELVPFKKVVDGSVSAIMSGHLLVPAYDSSLPCSLSPKIITDLLKTDWGFKGLALTDALNMKGLTADHSTEEIALGAFTAGHDCLLYGAHRLDDINEIMREIFPRAYFALETAYQQGTLSKEQLNASVLKILRAKEKLGLHKERLTRVDPHLMETLHDSSLYDLKKRLFQEAVTLIPYANQDLPLKPEHKYAYVQVGKEVMSFHDCLVEKTGLVGKIGFEPFFYGEDTKDSLFPMLKGFEAIVVGIYDICGNATNDFGLSRGAVSFFRELKQNYPHVIFVLFGTPYAVGLLPSDATVIVGYEPAKESEEVVSEILFGEREAKGTLPVTVVSP